MSTTYSSGFAGDKIAPLQFWTHKILPLVYDESLSYYEVLCKVAQKLNETIESVNLSTEEVTHMREIVDGIKDTVDAINTAMVKSVNGKTPDAEGGVIVDAPSVPLNPPLLINEQTINYLQEAIAALIEVDEHIANELHEYMTNSAPYLVQISNSGNTPELNVTGAEYDVMARNVGEHKRSILVSFPGDEYTYNGVSYRSYTQVGKLRQNGLLEAYRIVSVAGATLYEQYRFDRNGYIDHVTQTHPELPLVPNDDGEYMLVRHNELLQWDTTQAIYDRIDDADEAIGALNRYWKPTILPVYYAPSTDTAVADYAESTFNALPPREGAIVVEINSEGSSELIRVQGYYVSETGQTPYVHAMIHDKVNDKNVIRVFYLYSTTVNVVTYDLDKLNRAVLTVNGKTPDSTGAVSIDATEIWLGGTPRPISVNNKIAQMSTAIATLDQYWKPTVLPVTYASAGGSASPVYTEQEFNELPPTEGAILVEIRTTSNTTPVRVQGYFVPAGDTNEAYVRAMVHYKIGTKNVLRVFALYSTSVTVVTYDLDVLNSAVLTVNGISPGSNGALTLDSRNINVGGTATPISVHDKIVDIDRYVRDIADILGGVPSDGRRYKLTASYDTTPTKPTYQWVLDE